MSSLRKCRRQRYKERIVDVALEISQSDYWRQLLFSSDYNEKFLFNSDTMHEIQEYLKTIDTIFDCNLQFYVSKVLKCPVRYLMEDGYTIFKFQSVEFPEIVQYSGN